MASTVNVAGAIGFIFSIVAALMLAASMAAVYWKSPDFDITEIIYPITEVNTGLFQKCYFDGCIDIGWSTDVGITILTTRAILLIACILIGIGLIIGIVALCGKGDIIPKGALDIVAGLLVLAACGAYTGMTIGIDNYRKGQPTIRDFNWCFYLCWASSAVFIIAGSFEVNGKKKTGTTNTDPSHQLSTTDGLGHEHAPK